MNAACDSSKQSLAWISACVILRQPTLDDVSMSTYGRSEDRFAVVAEDRLRRLGCAVFGGFERSHAPAPRRIAANAAHIHSFSAGCRWIYEHNSPSTECHADARATIDERTTPALYTFCPTLSNKIRKYFKKKTSF